jgi:hypothetical protein
MVMISVWSSTFKGTTPTYPSTSPTIKSRGISTMAKECEKQELELLLSNIKNPKYKLHKSIAKLFKRIINLKKSYN